MPRCGATCMKMRLERGPPIHLPVMRFTRGTPRFLRQGVCANVEAGTDAIAPRGFSREPRMPGAAPPRMKMAPLPSLDKASGCCRGGSSR
jgi:hypothetical protein